MGREAASIPGLGEAAVSLLGVRERLIDEIRRLDRKLKAVSAASPATQALMTIPGVGVQTSAAFAAAVDDDEPVQAFANSRRVLRLGPAPAPSGELDWTGRITKQGDSTVRKLLYEAANSILTRMRKTFALKSWSLKIGLARHLAVIMHAMLRDGTLFEA